MITCMYINVSLKLFPEYNILVFFHPLMLIKVFSCKLDDFHAVNFQTLVSF